MVEGLSESLKKTTAPKTYIINLVTDPTETQGYKASDFIRKIEEYYCDGSLIDYAVVNTEPINERLSHLYGTENKFPIEPDLEACQRLVTKKVISGNFVQGKTILRHDSQHLAEILLTYSKPFPEDNADEKGCLQISSPALTGESALLGNI